MFIKIRLQSTSDCQVIAGEQKMVPDRLGDSVSNAIFHFDRGHDLLSEAIQLFPSSFDGKWASVGPVLLNKVLLKRCGFPGEKQIAMTTEIFTRERCGGVSSSA